MSIIEIICIAIGLSMDCFAVIIATSIHSNKLQISNIIKIGVIFALFQSIMPFIGWCLGVEFIDSIKQYTSIISFCILSFIGIKMICEGIKSKKDKVCDESLFTSYKSLIIIALSTNIDALGSGLIFAPCGNLIYTAMVILAISAFIFSIIGYWLGTQFGDCIKINPEIIGGIILILIGSKMLF